MMEDGAITGEGQIRTGENMFRNCFFGEKAFLKKGGELHHIHMVL